MYPISTHEFEVVCNGSQMVVDIHSRSCSCRIWQVEDFPCCHAIAALWSIKLSPRRYVSHFYTKDAYVATYAANVYPSGLNFFSDNRFVGQTPLSILPPDVRRRAGRPKKQRISSSGEHVKRRGHCGNCGQFGHNKRSCTSHGPESVAQYSTTESFQLY